MTTKLLGSRLSLHTALQSAPVTKFIKPEEEPEPRTSKIPKGKPVSFKKALMTQREAF